MHEVLVGAGVGGLLGTGAGLAVLLMRRRQKRAALQAPAIPVTGQAPVVPDLSDEAPPSAEHAPVATDRAPPPPDRAPLAPEAHPPPDRAPLAPERSKSKTKGAMFDVPVTYLSPTSEFVIPFGDLHKYLTASREYEMEAFTLLVNYVDNIMGLELMLADPKTPSRTSLLSPAQKYRNACARILTNLLAAVDAAAPSPTRLQDMRTAADQLLRMIDAILNNMCQVAAAIPIAVQ